MNFYVYSACSIYINDVGDYKELKGISSSPQVLAKSFPFSVSRGTVMVVRDNHIGFGSDKFLNDFREMILHYCLWVLNFCSKGVVLMVI